jgi:glycosyltransferase involved in cell wall biosynthesis
MNPAPTPDPGLPLRVAHLNSLLTGGGTDDQCVKLAHGLSRLGQQVWVTGPDGREFSKVTRDLQVPFHPTPPEGWLKLRFILAAARFIRRARIQIVHGHHGRDLWPSVLAARLSGRRPAVVLTRHMAKSPSSWFSRRFLLNRCDAMVAVSEFVGRVLLEGVYEPASPEPERRSRPPLMGDRSRVRVIHGGIDVSRFKPGDARELRESWGVQPDQFVFAVVGGYDLPRGKGQREFLRAAARVKDQVPQARFLVVGRGSLQPTLESDIAELGLRGRAWLPPYCKDMPAAMNALDCLVHPQVGTEAWGAVILEAFACGKPVIASALDGIPEAFAVGQAGRLVPPESVSDLAEAILEQARQPRPSLAERQALQRRVAEGYSLETCARNILALYRELCRGATR